MTHTPWRSGMGGVAVSPSPPLVARLAKIPYITPRMFFSKKPKPRSPLSTKPIRMVALDLDGTLLTSRKSISPLTHTAVRQVVAKGVHVILATARPRAPSAIITPPSASKRRSSITTAASSGTNAAKK